MVNNEKSARLQLIICTMVTTTIIIPSE